jgi:hypothetical protein
VLGIFVANDCTMTAKKLIDISVIISYSILYKDKVENYAPIAVILLKKFL